ncbi:MarR family winged helix-turn-helix transcriptional regulator, partial [Burkholderia cenocepacia]|uniref:MarR family winged helix-turn-helix transcriptional regulator n=1 Tax=Burkholderia cenocepacia TaxID=95486 RepID=UPI00398E7AA1
LHDFLFSVGSHSLKFQLVRKFQGRSGTLASMEMDGLIERRRHPSDGRQILFALTTEGFETRRKIRLAKREWITSAVSKLTPAEQQKLISAVALIRSLANS